MRMLSSVGPTSKIFSKKRVLIKMDEKLQAISTFAIKSRLFLLIFQLGANLLIPDHDAKVFYPPTDKSVFTTLDHIVHLIFGGLLRWDAVYFTHIMQHGYTYENCVAFFPFYPIVCSSIAKLLSMIGILHMSSCVLVIAVSVNYILFVITAQSLYKLGKNVLGDNEIAFNAAMLFCINPASIFMIAPYSEILYSFLLIQALLSLKSGSRIFASLFIALSVFTRSNGMVGIGFIVHDIAKSFFSKIYVLNLKHKDNSVSVFVKGMLQLTLKTIAEAITCLIISLSTFFGYQFYIYQKYCGDYSSNKEMPSYIHDYGRSQGYRLVGDASSPWCKEVIPLSYSYIQKHHWGVGFLKYYEFKQIPNFLLAAPVIVLSLRACLYFFKQNSKQFYYLGLWNDPTLITEHKNVEPLYKTNSDYGNESVSENEGPVDEMNKIEGSREDTKITKRQRKDNGSETCEEIRRSYTSDITQEPHGDDKSAEIIVYVFHLLGLTVFGCCFVHIQVLTRLLFSSSPLLFWYCGILMCKKKHSKGVARKQAMTVRNKEEGRTSQNLLLSVLKMGHFYFIADVVKNWTCFNFEFKSVFIYFITYCLVGTIMFSNFLPWT